MPPETTIVNLDYQAATKAQAALNGVAAITDAEKRKKATDTMDTVATNALGVLQEMGVYSCCLFLLSRRQDSHKEHARALLRQLIALLGELPFIDRAQSPLPNTSNAQATLTYVTTHVTAELDHVLLTRQVYEQMLLYVRYGAAALKS